MATETRQRLIEAAIRRFYRDGFRNVGIDQILADVGISKTAFYKHFESKDDLMLAALEVQNLWLQNTFHEMIRKRGGDSASGQLRAVLDVVEMIIESEEFQGCIFVNAAIKKALCRDARGDRAWLSKMRPMYGHDYHFHIRLSCPVGEAGCTRQEPVPEGDGCDASLAWWFTDEALHPKIDPNAKPKPPMTMAALPNECRAVLKAQ